MDDEGAVQVLDVVAALEKMASLIRQATRAVEALTDDFRLCNDATVRELGVEVDYPHVLLSEDDREQIRVRQLWRTLQDIDDLPEEAEHDR